MNRKWIGTNDKMATILMGVNSFKILLFQRDHYLPFIYKHFSKELAFFERAFYLVK